MKINRFTLLALFALGVGNSVPSLAQKPNYDFSQMQREQLGRGLIGIRQNNARVFLTWRYLSSDPMNITFRIYDSEGVLKHVTDKTSAIITSYTFASLSTYRLVPVIDGVEQLEEAQEYTIPANAPSGYLQIPLDIPEGGVTPANEAYTYTANDASVGDVDGDGEFEIILKWDPSNSKDNSQSGYTGNVFIDCYKLDGTKMWRIDLGKNIRAGAHYTQFQVYDYDGDGKAEMVCKTGDGSVDGVGVVIGDATKDYRSTAGKIYTGPEYLTIFNGETGAAMQTVTFEPGRGSDPDYWGDSPSYANRMDRFLSCTAYLDGKKPSVVMCRGYYGGQSGHGPGRTVLVAWDWDGTELTQKWTFDTKDGKSSWIGQGNHNLRVGDIDGDGCDEIVYGSMTVDHDGKGLYNTNLGHGDAIHMTVFDPASGDLAVWACHENKKDGSTFRDAATGRIIFQVKSGDDVGRCMAADVDPTRRGIEMWSSRSGGLRSINGTIIRESTSGLSMNMAAWWEGTLVRNLQDGVSITRYNYQSGGATTVLNAVGCESNNSTKANPCLVADIYGDWREELLVRTSDNSALRLYVSCADTIDYRFHTFLEDPVYRSSVAYQNVAYNQPTHVGFYFGADLGKMLTESYADDAWTLDAGMSYDAYEWLVNGEVAGRERSLVVPYSSIPTDGETTVTLNTTFRGYVFTESAVFSSTSSVTTDKAESIRIPAIVNDGLDIELSVMTSDIKILVYDVNGVMIAQTTVPAGNTSVQIDAASWNKGLYVVKIVMPNSSLTRKVFKQ